MYIFSVRALASRRRRPLSSNVRPNEEHFLQSLFSARCDCRSRRVIAYARSSIRIYRRKPNFDSPQYTDGDAHFTSSSTDSGMGTVDRALPLVLAPNWICGATALDLDKE